MILLDPNHHERPYPDDRSRQIMLSTIDFFEQKGKRQLKQDDHDRVWYDDFLDFVKDNRIFATLLTPPAYGSEDDCRWDTYRNCEFNEILGFYGLHYWYTWQVSILGLGPIWMSANEDVKRRAGALLEDGAIFAFGLSERTHGADVYATEMALTPQDDGSYLANGEKYYIGNGNKAEMVSNFGRFKDSDEYCFFIADYHHKQYELRKNIVNVQSYVADFALHDYPVQAEDLLMRGPAAWDTALNTVNVGKYNLGWASVGICTHAFYEALNHAGHRKLYGMAVTDMPHVRQMFTDAYVRLCAMKLYGLRCSDYLRSASADDRRYLLYDPTMKMKVTTQGEQVIDLLWDVIAAKGFETDTYFEMAARDIRALPKLEGTVHVNIMLIIKFMENYLFHPEPQPAFDTVDTPRNDDFLFDQGPARGLRKIRFADYREAYAPYEALPNVKLFLEQVEGFKQLLISAPPEGAQQTNPDFMLTLGEMFTLVPYGQLICEQAKIMNVAPELVDRFFDCMVRDLSAFALSLYQNPASTAEQSRTSLTLIRRPHNDGALAETVWQNHVWPLLDRYEMRP